MSTETPKSDGDAWARPVDHLQVAGVEPGATGRNVTGRRPTSPVHGFGRMWQKAYRVRLTGSAATPAEVIGVWKRDFPTFWPEGNRFFAPLAGIRPGEVAVIDLSMPGRLKLSTGVLVMYADDESFTLMTPQGHMFAGWITFSAFRDAGATVAQVQALIRASDPLYELGMVIGFLGAKEDRFWRHTLQSLAGRFGVYGQPVEMQVVRVDRARQWSRAVNVWRNAGVWSTLYLLAAPVRWIRRRARAAQ